MWKTFGVFAFIVLSPTLAHAAPQTHDEWYVNSGRYINGQVPSYDQVPSRKVYLATRQTRHKGRMIERRSSAFVPFIPQGYISTGREQMVMALGA